MRVTTSTCVVGIWLALSAPWLVGAAEDDLTIEIQNVGWVAKIDMPYGVKQFNQGAYKIKGGLGGVYQELGAGYGLFGAQGYNPDDPDDPDDQDVPCPHGKSCSAPGHNKENLQDCPHGNSCNAPGHQRRLAEAVDDTCIQFRFTALEEGITYCAGISTSDDKPPTKFTCTKDIVEEVDSGFIWLCGANPAKDYYYFMYASENDKKGPLVRSLNKFGPLRAIVSWIKAVQGACAIELYIQLEYDELLGPKDYRLVVTKTDPLGKSSLLAGSNSPFAFDEESVTFRIPAANGFNYNIDLTVAAGKINVAYDEAGIKFMNVAACDKPPTSGPNVYKGIYYYNANAIPDDDNNGNDQNCPGRSCSRGNANGNPNGNWMNTPAANKGDRRLLRD